MKKVIGFSGCSSTGKTTTAVHVAEALKAQGLLTHVVKSNAAEIFAKHGLAVREDFNRVKDFDVIMSIQEDILEDHIREINKHRNLAILVSDRTPADMLSFTILRVAAEDIFAKKENSKRFDNYVLKCAENVKLFSDIFLFNRVLPYKDDEKRVAYDEVQQQLFHLSLTSAYEDLGVKPHIIDFTDLQERVSFVLNKAGIV